METPVVYIAANPDSTVMAEIRDVLQQQPGTRVHLLALPQVEQGSLTLLTPKPMIARLLQAKKISVGALPI
jgi:hypothetical protein